MRARSMCMYAWMRHQSTSCAGCSTEVVPRSMLRFVVGSGVSPRQAACNIRQCCRAASGASSAQSALPPAAAANAPPQQSAPRGRWVFVPEGDAAQRPAPTPPPRPPPPQHVPAMQGPHWAPVSAPYGQLATGFGGPAHHMQASYGAHPPPGMAPSAPLRPMHAAHARLHAAQSPYASQAPPPQHAGAAPAQDAYAQAFAFAQAHAAPPAKQA